MMVILSLLFWGLLFLLFYTYAGYPLILYLAAFSRKGSTQDSTKVPSVSIIVSAYNEEDVVEEKINNTLSLDYPSELIEVIVVSDASTDRTNDIVERFQDNKVQLIVNEQRRGKSYSLNRAFDRAKGDILVFTDANAMFDPQTLRKMVRRFVDRRIGLVTGSTLYFSRQKKGNLIQPMGLYTRTERWIKALESKIGSCVGADGAVFGVRRSLYKPLADADINDLVTPLATVRQGYRVILDKEVFCQEEHSTDLSKEFWRQVRINNRTIRAVIANLDLVNPFRYPLFSWMLFSHKVLRFLFPFIFLFSLLINILLLFSLLKIYWVTFLGLTAAMSLVGLSAKLEFGPFYLLRSFGCLNTAILVAWKNVFTHQIDVTWEQGSGH